MQPSTCRERIFGRRLTAYLIDWLVSVVLGCLLILLTGFILLIASDLDRRHLPVQAVYAALLILSLWPPLWLLYTTLSWTIRGATVGMAVLSIVVIDTRGMPPGLGRSLWRALALALFSVPLAAMPVLVLVLVSMGSVGPAYTLVPVFAPILIAAVGCAAGIFAKDGRTWHDRLSGTRVVLARRASESC